MFNCLHHRGYRVFLDTASVEKGVEFQTHLWERLSDTDLVLFLGSPQALSSDWVRQEIANAGALGLGIVQVIWPGDTFRTREELEKIIKEKKLGEDFTEPFVLHSEDFEACQPCGSVTLNKKKEEELLNCIEKTRIRSLGARRQNLIGEVVAMSKRLNLTSTVHPWGAVELSHKDGFHGCGLILSGVPDSIAFHDAERNLADRLKEVGAANSRLIYNQVGLTPECQAHLGWLNSLCGLKAASIERLENWLPTLP
jgi:hypothetical protein